MEQPKPHYTVVSPTSIMDDINAMIDVLNKPRSLTAATYSGTAAQLRFLGFAVPMTIDDNRYVTVVID